MRKKKHIILEELLVENYAAEGKSLARRDGKVVFIENVVPGDVVDVRLLKNKKDWAEGQPVRFQSYSKERVDPFCQHFGICGGCQWQMLPYHKQLEYKQQQVLDNLTRIGKVVLPEMLPIAKALSVDVGGKTTVEVQAALKEIKAGGGSSQSDDEEEETPKSSKSDKSAKGKKDADEDDDDASDDDVEYPEVKVMKKQIRMWANFPAHKEEIEENIGPEYYDEDDDATNPAERLHQTLADLDTLKEQWKDNVHPMIEDGSWKKVEKHAAKA